MPYKPYKDPEFWENEYYDWKLENCQCDLEEDGCCCPNFDRWVEEMQSYMAEGMTEDDYERFA